MALLSKASMSLVLNGEVLAWEGVGRLKWRGEFALDLEWWHHLHVGTGGGRTLNAWFHHFQVYELCTSHTHFEPSSPYPTSPHPTPHQLCWPKTPDIALVENQWEPSPCLLRTSAPLGKSSSSRPHSFSGSRAHLSLWISSLAGCRLLTHHLPGSPVHTSSSTPCPFLYTQEQGAAWRTPS